MHSYTFETPEAAALEGFPDAHCRIVAARVSEDAAYVLLDSGPSGQPHLYGSSLVRRNGGWAMTASSNGPSWTSTGEEGEFGTLVHWDLAPDGADQVLVSVRGETRIEPVTNGVYLAAWWRVPCPDLTYPRVEAFRIQGRWIPAVHGRSRPR